LKLPACYQSVGTSIHYPGAQTFLGFDSYIFLVLLPPNPSQSCLKEQLRGAAAFGGGSG